MDIADGIEVSVGWENEEVVSADNLLIRMQQCHLLPEDLLLQYHPCKKNDNI